MANWITIEDSLKGRALAVERAVKEERERIIKLLEEVWRDYPPIEDVIAEIKGKSNADISTI